MLSLATIDRTIFELLRRGAVSVGKLPDWRTVTGATLKDRQDAYEAQKTALRTNTQLIEVFSIGSAESRDTKSVNKIVLTRKSTAMGTIGANGVEGYEKRPDGSFDKFKYPDSTVTLMYEIRIIGAKTEYERLMSNIITSQIGRRRNIKSVDGTWNFTGEMFTIDFAGSVNVSSTDFVEWVFNYRVSDVWVADAELIASVVPALTTININTILVPFNELLTDLPDAVNFDGSITWAVSAPSSPIYGQVYANMASKELFYWNGASWIFLGNFAMDDEINTAAGIIIDPEAEADWDNA